MKKFSIPAVSIQLKVSLCFILRYILCLFCSTVGANLTYKFTFHVNSLHFMLPRQFSV